MLDAERFRREIAKDVSKKIAMIQVLGGKQVLKINYGTPAQNPGLGEYKIRDLNDEINKMLRIKLAWEWRIKELGGPDYRFVGLSWHLP